MADENVTKNETTTETTAQETREATQAPKPAAPKPHAPSPAAFAKKAAPAARRVAAPAAATYTETQVKQAESFGHVDENGTVFVKDGDGEREVGQFPDVSKEEALALYAVVSLISRPSSMHWPHV